MKKNKIRLKEMEKEAEIMMIEWKTLEILLG